MSIFLKYRMFAAAAIIIGILVYVMSLHDSISDRNDEISKLNKEITTQNTAIELAGKDRDILQRGLDIAKNNNKVLEKEAGKMHDILSKRPIALTCEAAFSNIVETAKTIANDWNTP